MKENKFHKLNMKKKEDSCQFIVFPPLSWLSNFNALFYFISFINIHYLYFAIGWTSLDVSVLISYFPISYYRLSYLPVIQWLQYTTFLLSWTTVISSLPEDFAFGLSYIYFILLFMFLSRFINFISFINDSGGLVQF